MAKAGTTEATIVEKNIKTILEEMAGQVLRAKYEHEKLLKGILENADRIHEASKIIGRVSFPPPPHPLTPAPASAPAPAPAPAPAVPVRSG